MHGFRIVRRQGLEQVAEGSGQSAASFCEGLHCAGFAYRLYELAYPAGHVRHVYRNAFDDVADRLDRTIGERFDTGLDVFGRDQPRP